MPVTLIVRVAAYKPATGPIHERGGMSGFHTIACMKNAKFDRTFRHSLAEAKLVGVTWLAALLWTVGYGYFAAMPGETIPPVDAVLGIPYGVFWGIAVPWTACTLFTACFALFLMHDDDLEAGTNP